MVFADEESIGDEQPDKTMIKNAAIAEVNFAFIAPPKNYTGSIREQA